MRSSQCNRGPATAFMKDNLKSRIEFHACLQFHNLVALVRLSGDSFDRRPGKGPADMQYMIMSNSV